MRTTLHPTNTNPQESQLDEELAHQKEEAGDELDSFNEFDETEPDTEPQANYSRFGALFKLLPLGISSLTLLYLLHLGGQINSLRQGGNQVLVQTVDGRSIIAEKVDDSISAELKFSVERTENEGQCKLEFLIIRFNMIKKNLRTHNQFYTQCFRFSIVSDWFRIKRFLLNSQNLIKFSLYFRAPHS